VAHRRPAHGVDTADARLQHGQVPREGHVQARLVAEVQHEHLIVGVRGAHQREGGRLHLRALALHAAAVVDQDAEGDGHVVAVEDGEGLALAVLVDRERAAVEVLDHLPARVLHRGLEDHEADLGAEDGTRRRDRGGGREQEGWDAEERHLRWPVSASWTSITASAGNETSRPLPSTLRTVERATPTTARATVTGRESWLMPAPSRPRPKQPRGALLPPRPYR